VRAWREVFGFSKWILLFNLVGFVYARSADFIIGRLSATLMRP